MSKVRNNFNVVLASLISKGLVIEVGSKLSLTAKGLVVVDAIYDTFSDESLVLIYVRAVSDYKTQEEVTK